MILVCSHSVFCLDVLLSAQRAPTRVPRKGVRTMYRRPRRRKPRSTRTDRLTMWSWTSQDLLIPQRIWLGIREYDARHPACHYNLHIQPACGGLDYHNYHIRYLGAKGNQHVWSVVDAPFGREQSHRVYAFSQESFLPEVIDLVSNLLVTDITTDVSDLSLWPRLSEPLALVLFDLYRNHLEKTPGRRL